MADTGFIAATSASGSGWTNPTNVIADDDSFATFAATGGPKVYSALLVYFPMPLVKSEMIVGAEVVIRHKLAAAGASIYVTRVQIISTATPQGDDTSDGPNLTATETAETRGGATSLWGQNTSNFNVLMRASGLYVRVVYQQSDAAAATIQVDYVGLKVYYEHGTTLLIADQGSGSGWNDPDNIKYDDDVYAFAYDNWPTSTSTVFFGWFSHLIDPDKWFVGAEVQIRHKSSKLNYPIDFFYLDSVHIVGDTAASGIDNTDGPNISTSEVQETRGSPTDTWGLSVQDFNTLLRDTGIKTRLLYTYEFQTGGIMYIDYIELRLYWLDPETVNASLVEAGETIAGLLVLPHIGDVLNFVSTRTADYLTINVSCTTHPDPTVNAYDWMLYPTIGGVLNTDAVTTVQTALPSHAFTGLDPKQTYSVRCRAVDTVAGRTSRRSAHITHPGQFQVSP